MKYVIQDTETGYELQIARSRSEDNEKMAGSRIIYREHGGHGPVEKLYAIAAGVQRLQQAERGGKSLSVSELTSLGLHTKELLTLIEQRVPEAKAVES
jgi:hypothetical protein